MKQLLCVVLISLIYAFSSANSLNQKLFKAVKKENVEEITLLIHNGANVNALNNKGYSPFHLAVLENNVEIIKLLVEAGGDLNYKCKTYCNTTLLCIAAINQAHESAAFLLAKGIDVNGVSEQCMSPLMYATHWDDIKMMNILLEHNANINQLDNEGKNALFYVTSKPAFGILYESGIDLQIIDKNGYSALISLWSQKFDYINEVLCTLFYEGAIFHTPEENHSLYLRNNFIKPEKFKDSLLIVDYIDELNLFLEEKNCKERFYKQSRFGINLVGSNKLSDEFDNVLIVGLPYYDKPKDDEPFKGFVNKNYQSLQGKKEYWAQIKYKGSMYYAKEASSGYLILSSEHCGNIKFFNLLLTNPETGKNIRIYGPNHCMKD